MNAIDYAPDGSRREWDGAAGVLTAYAPDGTVTDARPFTPDEAALYPPGEPAINPIPDLPTLAEQVTQLVDAVNLLILNDLGV